MVLDQTSTRSQSYLCVKYWTVIQNSTYHLVTFVGLFGSMPCIDYMIYGLLIVDGSKQKANHHTITVKTPQSVYGVYTMIFKFHSRCQFSLAKLYLVSIRSD